MQFPDQKVMAEATQFAMRTVEEADNRQLPITTALTGLSVAVYSIALQLLLEGGVPLTKESVGTLLSQHATYTLELAAKLVEATQPSEGESS